tara:strand:+ start:6940 stop:7953 length:1014 start_codon:yes stop_codon:yes gene_type:complete
MELRVENVNEAFQEILWKFKVLNLQTEETRNGPALVYPEMVTTIYRFPDERVLFHPKRDANPIFHLMEAIWMIAGRNDVQFVNQFNSNMKNFSDDGKVFNAAYGHRWRKHFGTDQLLDVISLLKQDISTRQAVIQMWDAEDLVKETCDKACNTQLIFDTRNNKLNMTVFNRSNDVWWGAYGANAVHFSFLQEVIARAINYPLGEYRQVSNNFHFYTELYDAMSLLDNPPNEHSENPYHYGEVSALPLMDNDDYAGFILDCEQFCKDPFGFDTALRTPNYKFNHSFFMSVARPMALISWIRKHNNGDGMLQAKSIKAPDWKRACEEWIIRRDSKNNEK